MRVSHHPLQLTALLAALLCSPPEPAAGSPQEEIYVLSSPFPGAGSVSRYVPDTGEGDVGLFSVGTTPNEIDIVGRLAYVVSSATNSLVVVNLDAPGSSQQISLAPESNPWNVEIAGSRAYVSNLLTDSVSEIDLASGSVVGTIPVGRSPEGLLIHGSRLYVANTGFDFDTFTYGHGSVSVIDLNSGLLLGDVETGTNPQALALDAQGRVHVACTGDFFSIPGEVDIIDPVGLAVVQAVPIGGSPGSIAIDAAGRGYLGSYFEGVLVYDVSSGAPIRDAADPVDVGGFGASGLLAARSGGVWVAVSDASDLLARVEPDLSVTPILVVDDGPLSLARSRAFAPPASQARAALPAAAGGPALRLGATPIGGARVRARIEHETTDPIELFLYDVSGRLVASRWVSPGASRRTEVEWDLGGTRVASGRYQMLARSAAARATAPVLIRR